MNLNCGYFVFQTPVSWQIYTVFIITRKCGRIRRSLILIDSRRKIPKIGHPMPSSRFRQVRGDYLTHYKAFFGLAGPGHVALGRNAESGYNTLLLQLVPGDLVSACPHRQFLTLPDLLKSRAAMSNSSRNTCVPHRDAVCTMLWSLG